MKQTKPLAHVHNVNLASILLRIGLAVVFIYAAVSAFREPSAWLSYIPTFTSKFISAKLLLDIFSVLQIVVALWLLSGKYLKYAAGVAALLLLGIIVPNLNTLLVTFRDIGLLFMAIALIFLDY